jgi:hypothetical protein
VWINYLYLTPTATGSVTDRSGSVPVPIDARPFRIILQTIQVTATPGGHLDCTALPLPLLTMIEECFALLNIALPPRLRLWTEVTEGTDTVVEPTGMGTSLVDLY